VLETRALAGEDVSASVEQYGLNGVADGLLILQARRPAGAADAAVAPAALESRRGAHCGAGPIAGDGLRTRGGKQCQSDQLLSKSLTVMPEPGA
jgi:hypothetical protein